MSTQSLRTTYETGESPTAQRNRMIVDQGLRQLNALQISYAPNPPRTSWLNGTYRSLTLTSGEYRGANATLIDLRVSGNVRLSDMTIENLTLTPTSVLIGTSLTLRGNLVIPPGARVNLTGCLFVRAGIDNSAGLITDVVVVGGGQTGAVNLNCTEIGLTVY